MLVRTCARDWVGAAGAAQDVEYSVAHRGQQLYVLVREPAKPNSELRVMGLGAGGKDAQVRMSAMGRMRVQRSAWLSSETFLI